MNTLRHESIDLRGRYDEEPSHSDHVADLALQLFDELRSSFALEERARELLHSAALLHDIGWSQRAGGKGHHKESARLIREHGWKSLALHEVSLVAQVARYHRKSLPRPEHDAYQALAPAQQKLVLVLGGILRVADALDRTHTGRIKKLSAEVTAEKVIVRVQPQGNWEAERAMFEAKRDMLELAAERPVKCEAVK
jgi:exopolyphosphatase/pppGpp-phosphohydrolase